MNPAWPGNEFWLIVGFAGQFLFFMRFFVQWIASEKARRSVIPDAFWYFSILGGGILTIYAVSQRDPVFIVGQGAGLVIYSRNLYLIRRARKNNEAVATALAD